MSTSNCFQFVIYQSSYDLVLHILVTDSVMKKNHTKHDRQCMYNATLWHVHITIVAMEI